MAEITKKEEKTKVLYSHLAPKVKKPKQCVYKKLGECLCKLLWSQK